MKIFPIILATVLLCFSCQEKKKTKPFVYFSRYQATFNDLHPRHLAMAEKWGIKPIVTDEEFDDQEDNLEEISSCDDYKIDKLTHSLPYLVPKAEELLETIGENFIDSLDSKGLDERKIIVTSVLRTRGTVKNLQKGNINASSNSTHLYGTTFDIAYTRFEDQEKDDELDKYKSVLAEVLRDLRNKEECYVLYEIRQACFHITVR